MRDVVLSRLFFSAFEILCLMRQTTLQLINIEDKCFIFKFQQLRGKNECSMSQRNTYYTPLHDCIYGSFSAIFTEV